MNEGRRNAQQRQTDTRGRETEDEREKKKKKNSCNIHSAGNHDENSWNM